MRSEIEVYKKIKLLLTLKKKYQGEIFVLEESRPMTDYVRKQVSDMRSKVKDIQIQVNTLLWVQGR